MLTITEQQQPPPLLLLLLLLHKQITQLNMNKCNHLQLKSIILLYMQNTVKKACTSSPNLHQDMQQATTNGIKNKK